MELDSNIINEIKKDIADASGQEIFLIGSIDRESFRINDYNILARGNAHMVPAILSDLRPGQVIIHNHPSGDLTPSGNDIGVAARVGERGIGFAIINNNVDEIYVVVEPKLPKEEVEIKKEDIINIFKPDGKLSEIMRDYEYREEQIEVLNEVILSFNNHCTSLIEAGTGTGKSFAYLIPALYWSYHNGEPVVVSTNTINLQEQLLKKDLLLLKDVLPFPFKAILVKGRRNYVCKRKVKNLEKMHDMFTEDKKLRLEFIKILQWLDDTETGTRSDINFVITNSIWDKIASESDMCLNTKCPYFDTCYFMKARKEVYSADILIVNHHLLLSDAKLKMENRAILPEYKNLIIDEAHNFNNVATYHLGTPFYSKLINKFFERLTEYSYSTIPVIRDNLGDLSSEDKKEVYKIIDTNILQKVKSIKEITVDYFNLLEDFIPESKENKLRMTEDVYQSKDWQKVINKGEKLAGYFKNLGINLNSLYEKLAIQQEKILNGLKEQLIELEGQINNCNQLVTALEFNIYAEDNSYVFWLEKDGQSTGQENAPLDISTLLRNYLWDKISNLILTSATLTINNDFQFYKNALGLKKVSEIKIESPYDYSKQAKLFIPDDIPAANSPQFLNQIINKFTDMLISFGGSTMVLFTSYKMLNYCLKRVKKKINCAGINILAQGKYPRHYIIESFKNNSSQVIFGTVSFWEGVDIKGENLKYLIIMKLPFPVPTEPVAAARRERLKKEGRNDFYSYSLPKAVIRFRQGFGRLIRSRTDSGLIFVADNRIIKKSYGKFFLQSLPQGCPVITDKIDNLIVRGGKNED